MSTRGKWIASLVASAFFSAGTAQALTVDEVIRLTQAGVGEPVVISQIQADATPVSLSAEDLVALKQAHVSDTVILALQQAAQAHPAAAALPRRALAGGSDDVAPRTVSRSAAVLVTNDSSRDLTLLVDPDARRISFAEAGRGDSLLASGSSRIVRLPFGGYDVGWTGAASNYGVQAAGRRAELVVRDRRVAGVSSLALDVIEDGELVDGGTLKRFEVRARANDSEAAALARDGEGAETYTGTQVRRGDGVQITINNSASAPSNSPSYAPPAPQPRPATVYAPPPPTVTYAPPPRRMMTYETPFERRVEIEEAHCWSEPRGAYRSADYGRPDASSDGPLETILGENWQSGMPGARTLVGAGIGAVIGHQYREKGKGAAIGAGVGYLLDQFLKR